MLLMLLGTLVVLVMGGCVGWSIAGHVRKVGVWTLEIAIYSALTCVLGFAVGMGCTAFIAGGGQ